MKKIPQQSVLKAVFARVYGREFQATVMDDRVMMQKAVFLLREFGVSCGPYDFVWDYYGPFSPDLSDDMKMETPDGIPSIEFDSKAIRVMDLLAEVFSEYKKYSPRYWAEAVASFRYCMAYMYPSCSEEEVISKLEAIKTGSLKDHEENIRAMKSMKKLFASKG